MIQRIQTIFLILYIGALVSTFFFPVWQKISFDGNNSVDTIITGYVTTVDFNSGDSSILYDGKNRAILPSKFVIIDSNLSIN